MDNDDIGCKIINGNPCIKKKNISAVMDREKYFPNCVDKKLTVGRIHPRRKFPKKPVPKKCMHKKKKKKK